MVRNDKMPDAPTLGLTEARCRSKDCNMLLAKVRLSANSVVEIKCRRCNAVNAFTVEQKKDAGERGLIPDGQGGYHPPLD